MAEYKNGPPATPALAMIFVALLCLFGCRGRDVSSPEKAMLGHWTNPDSETHYYTSPERVIMMERGKRSESTYKIVESHQIDYWLSLRVTSQFDYTIMQTWQISNDRRAINITWHLVTGQDVKEERVYVDDKQEP